MELRRKIMIIIVACILFLILNVRYNIILATTIDTDIEIGKTTAVTSNQAFTERILGAFQVLGSVVSIAALTIIGIRYMLSSIEERAQMKGVLVYYVVGAILVFATTNVLGILYDVLFNL